MTYRDPFFLNPTTVGFDRVARLFADSIEKKAATYPPYNIIKNDENQYAIEIAVAGFTEQDIDIQVAERILYVSGQTKTKEETNYLHKGVAQRNFVHKFTLADTIEVKDANLNNGMLTIQLENVIPEEKKPRQIEITTTKKQLLTE